MLQSSRGAGPLSPKNAEAQKHSPEYLISASARKSRIDYTLSTCKIVAQLLASRGTAYIGHVLGPARNFVRVGVGESATSFTIKVASDRFPFLS